MVLNDKINGDKNMANSLLAKLKKEKAFLDILEQEHKAEPECREFIEPDRCQCRNTIGFIVFGRFLVHELSDSRNIYPSIYA